MMFRPVTLQEANLFLPLVKEHFAQIHSLVAEGQSIHEERSVDVNGSVQKIISPEAQKQLEALELKIKNEVVSLQYYGAIVKSVYPARVDFLSERHKQPVFLCWQMGDKNISHWHPVDEGFGTRRAISDPQVFGSDVIH